MRTLLLAFALVVLAGCAGDRYTRHEDGWWTERAPRAGGSISVGYGWGASGYCRPWYGPWAYSPYAWNGCPGYGFGPAYGYAPYPYRYWWPYRHGWYAPPPILEQPRAGARARNVAGAPAWPDFPRYEDIAPGRQRDLGGDRAYRQRSAWPAPAYQEPRQGGLSGASRNGWSGGIGGAARESGRYGGGRESASASRGMSTSTGASTRAEVRRSREED